MILEYHRPETIPAAISLLSRPSPRTLPLGGGSILGQPSRESFAVVDLQGLGLDHLSVQGQSVVIGATVRLQNLLEAETGLPGLGEVIRLEAAANLRRVASVAGTLVAADGRSPFTTAMLGLDARLTLEPGEEELDLGDLLPVRAGRLKGRLITQISIPHNVSLAYQAVSRTPADWPLVCAAIVRWPGGRTRVALGGYGQSPILAFDGPDTGGIDSAVVSAYSHAGDVWASADYRKEMALTLTARALSQISMSQE